MKKILIVFVFLVLFFPLFVCAKEVSYDEALNSLGLIKELVIKPKDDRVYTITDYSYTDSEIIFIFDVKCSWNPKSLEEYFNFYYTNYLPENTSDKDIDKYLIDNREKIEKDYLEFITPISNYEMKYSYSYKDNVFYLNIKYSYNILDDSYEVNYELFPNNLDRYIYSALATRVGTNFDDAFKYRNKLEVKDTYFDIYDYLMKTDLSILKNNLNKEWDYNLQSNNLSTDTNRRLITDELDTFSIDYIKDEDDFDFFILSSSNNTIDGFVRYKFNLDNMVNIPVNSNGSNGINYIPIVLLILLVLGSISSVFFILKKNNN